MSTPVADMSEDDVLEFAAARAKRIRADKTDLLVAAYQVAVINDVDGLGPDRDLPGRERAKRFGGEGTPEVLEFAAAGLAARMGTTAWAAEQLIADALDLHHRTPGLWQLLLEGKVDPDYARLVVKKTRSMSPEAAQRVAAAVAESADARVPWGRFVEILAGAIAAADPDAARERERVAAESACAKKVRDEADGTGTFLAHGPIWMINQIAAAVAAYSAALKDDFPHLSDDQRDVLALMILVTPGAASALDQDPSRLSELMPVVHLYVHTYAGPDATGVARLEGHGPVTDAWVQALGPHCRFKIQPVIDIPGLAPVDGYEIPHRHREAVHLMTPADTSPYGSNLTRTKQVDHTEPYRKNGPPGQSRVGNYGPMTVPHHRIKTHGGWDVKQPFPGIYVWRDKHGAHYLVDNTGTRRIARGESRPIVVEIYRDLPRTELDLAA